MTTPAHGSDLSLRQLLTITSCFFVSMTDLKIGPVQVAEFLMLLLLTFYFSLELFGFKNLEFKLQDGLIVTFFATTAISAVYSLNTESFSIPSDANSILKQPGWISLARIIQLLVLFFCYKLIILECKKNPGMIDSCIKLYIYSGFLASLYGLLSFFLLSTTGINLGGAYGEFGYRLRAFYVEGGPYGLFAGSVILLLLARWNSGNFSPMRKNIILLCVGLSFLLAQSKSAFFALFLTILMSFLLRNPTYLIRHVKSFLFITALISIAAIYSGANEVFTRIINDQQSLIENPDLFAEDNNFAMGRIAGGIIVPQMIAENPVLGIGLGNYSLLRDTEKYNHFLPKVDLWDLHGLGLFGFTAEVGILGVLIFASFFLHRYICEFKSGDSVFHLAIAAYPVAALIFGVQPTFSYPWILLAISESISKNK